MEVCITVLILTAVIGQLAAQRLNQPINNQLGYQAGNYVNNDGNVANQLNNLLRQQVQQQNLIKFKQDQYAQQNLAGGTVFQQQNQNAQAHILNAQVPRAQQGMPANQQVEDLSKNSQQTVKQVDSANQNAGLVKQGVTSLHAKLANSAYVRPDQLSGVNQQNQDSQFQGNLQNNQNQNNQQNQLNQDTQNQVQQQNQNFQNNQFQNNNQIPNNQAGQAHPVNQQNLDQNGANIVNVQNQGVVPQVKEEAKVPEVVTAAPFINAGADKLAEDDRQKSARLEQHVDTPTNNDNRNNEKNIPANINPQPVNNYFNGGGVNVNVQDNNFQRPPVREIGGMRLTWDWSDFAIGFDDYGGAEMKVRRAPHATTGEPWPLPQYYVKKDNRVYKLDKDLFTFKVIGETCDIIQEAVERYRTRVLEDAVEDMYDNLQNAPGTNVDDPALKYDSDVYSKANTISKVDIKIRKPCQKYPSVHSDESYDLVVKKSRAFIWANEVWGALRGLETFSHIVWKGLDGEDPDDRGKNANLFVKETVISDYPRFPHRGILVDSSRHFFFKETIFDILDGMEQNKMNVLHWHIVDDQSFPYQSAVFPDLSRKGAFHPTFVYTQKDIAEIIDYARFRGIRVMPEFDTPGHTYSWGLSRPDLLTQCYQGGNPVKGYYGPIDPTKNSTYRFLKNLFAEVLDTFKDQYIHLGGDEVPLGCWQSNPDVVNFGMELSKQANGAAQSAQYNNYYPGQFDVRKVYEYYENRLMKDLREIGRHRKDGVKFVMWQEVMNNDLQLPNDTIIEVWMGDMADVNRAISMGYQVLYATCWYLDHVEYGTKWPKYYQCDPADNTFGYMIDEKKVLGGEACLWSEYIDNENMMTTMWPRASAVAERLWSAKDVRDLDTAGARLSEHRCRMLNRGLSIAQISGPDYCLKRGVGRTRDKYRTNSTCTSGRCVKSRDPNNPFVDIDMDNHLQQRLAKIPDCPKSPSHGGLLIFLATVAVVLLAVAIGVKSTSGRLSQARVLCRNRTILMLFVSVLIIYFLCYTSIWMQVFDFAAYKKHDNVLDYKH